MKDLNKDNLYKVLKEPTLEILENYYKIIWAKKII